MAAKKKEPKQPPSRVERPRIPGFMLFRMFVLGAVSVVAAAYGIYRYYTAPHHPMLVPAPSSTEIPAPDLEPAPPGSDR